MRFQIQGTMAMADLHGVYQQDAKDLLSGWLNTARGDRAAGHPRLPAGHRPAGHAAQRLFPPKGESGAAQLESGGDEVGFKEGPTVTTSGTGGRSGYKQAPWACPFWWGECVGSTASIQIE